MEEKEEGGISLGDIFRIIFSQKWLALIITAVITIVGTVGIYFYGKKDEVYSATFVMQFPGSEESPTAYVYPDGTPFHYTDLISEENLETAKSKDAVFADIDIKKMRENGDISIKRELLETATGSNTYIANYTLTVKASYFKTGDAARDFIKELVELPVSYFANMQLSYDAYLVAAADVIAYDKKISYLQSQANYLTGRYDAFINEYGEDTVANGKMLRAYASAIQVLYDNQVFDQLKSEARLNGYVISAEAAADYYNVSNFENLNDQLKIEKAALDNLLSANTEGSSSSSSVIINGDRIVEQTRLVGDLELEIKYFNNFKENKTVSEQFNTSVSDLENRIKTFTEEFVSVAQEIYSTATKVSYANANIVEVEGGRGLIMSLLISLVAGLVVAAIVAYIVGYRKLKKSKAAAAEPVIVYPEAQLQIAAAKDEEEKEDKEDK